MKTLYFDCYSGVSGDMILAALLDLGLDQEQWLKALQGLSVSNFQVEFVRTSRQNLSATQVFIRVQDPQPERHLREIEAIIKSSELSPPVQKKSLEVFRCLAEAEAKIHGCSTDQVHFHEVGAVDALVDVVGSCLALDMLEVEAVYSSPVGVGQGYASAAHGMMPLPPPATLEILKGVPLHFTGIETELATPTGAALLKTLAQFSQPPLTQRLVQVGYGAGAKVIPQIPNVLRALLCETEAHQEADQAILIETNIDNLNPEIYPHVIEKLLEAGAMDAYLIPLIMKKGRPGVLLSALSPPGGEDRLLEVIYRETSTLGVRMLHLDRLKLPRREIFVETSLGRIRGKEARWKDTIRCTPEFEDCRRIAREKGIALQDVYRAFQQAPQSEKDP